jgi:hypothetical protein
MQVVLGGVLEHEAVILSLFDDREGEPTIVGLATELGWVDTEVGTDGVVPSNVAAVAADDVDGRGPEETDPLATVELEEFFEEGADVHGCAFFVEVPWFLGVVRDLPVLIIIAKPRVITGVFEDDIVVGAPLQGGLEGSSDKRKSKTHFRCAVIIVGDWIYRIPTATEPPPIAGWGLYQVRKKCLTRSAAVTWPLPPIATR